MLAALFVIAPASMASALSSASARAGYPRIVNGLPSHAYPTTGAMLRGDKNDLTQHLPINVDTARGWCSGTLIGCRTFLTAGHCVEDLLPDETWVYLQHAGLLTVTAVTRHPAFAFPVADLAVLKLGAPVSGIEPMALNLTDPNPFIPAGGTVAGFGSTGGVNAHADGGLLYAGHVQTTACVPSLSPDPDSEFVCFDFFDPIGPAGDDSNTCHGDSGGPLFLDLGDGPVVAGVTTDGTGSFCLNEHSYDASVYTYRDFILAELGADSTTTCGGLPSVGDPQVEVLGFDGTLDESAPSASHTFSVGASKNSVRVTMNGHHSDPSHLYDVVNMYVKAAPGASATDFDCKADGASAFGACIFDLPAAGTYSVFLQGVAGPGDYQVTATIFGGPPPLCVGDCNSDGVVAINELVLGVNIVLGVEPETACSAFANSLESADIAQLIEGVNNALNECGAAAPTQTCGNHIREGTEDCDGYDGACPGCCLSNCICPSTACGQ